MIIVIIGLFVIFLMICLIFRDSYMLRDLKNYFIKKTRPRSRTAITLRNSQPTEPYQFADSEPKNFSQPRNGKMNQYDFNLPALPHHTSTYFSSSAFLANKIIKKTTPIMQPLADSSIVEHHRFYHEAHNQKQKIDSQKQKSKQPSNQDIYKSAQQFHDKKLNSSFSQISSSAENPYVLPSIVAKKETAQAAIVPTVSSTSEGGDKTSGFKVPTPPPSAKKFNFTKPSS